MLSQSSVFSLCLPTAWASQVALLVKKLPAMQETQVRSLSQEDPPEEGVATHSSILAWRISWTEEPDELQSKGLKELDTTDLAHLHANCMPTQMNSGNHMLNTGERWSARVSLRSFDWMVPP